MNLLPLTAALSPLAAEQGVDLTPLATAEMEFERKLRDLQDWVRLKALSHTVKQVGERA